MTGINGSKAIHIFVSQIIFMCYGRLVSNATHLYLIHVQEMYQMISPNISLLIYYTDIMFSLWIEEEIGFGK